MIEKDEILKIHMSKLGIKINKHTLTQGECCLIVISHAFLKSFYYNKLVHDVKKFKKISQNSAKKHVLKYIQALERKKNIDLKNWLPDKRHKISDAEVKNWIKLLEKYGNMSKIRKILDNEKKYVPQATTLSKYIIKSIGYEKYKSFLNKKVDCVKRTPYESLYELAKKISIQKTGVKGKLITSKEEYEKTPFPDGAYLIWFCGKCQKKFKQSPHQIKKGSWCKKCSEEQRRLDMIIPIQEIRMIAEEVGIEKTGYPGKFLVSEKEYYKKRDTAPNKTKFLWECGKCSFQWLTVPNKVKNRRQWCPYCSQGYSEKIVRGFFERIFKRKFPSTSIIRIIKDLNHDIKKIISDFFKNQQENINELINNGHFDGFNKILKLAFEYQGEQHFIYKPNIFHNSCEDFLHRIQLDKLKKALTMILGINLIVLNYKITFDKMQDNIIVQYEKLTEELLPKMPQYNYKEFLIPHNKGKIFPIKDTWTNKEIQTIKQGDNENKLVVIDIETTGGKINHDKITEIGIVELDINTGDIKILFNSLINEDGFEIKKYMDSYGLKNSGISPFKIDLLKNHSIDDFKDILGQVFKSSKVASWAINNFDFLWLESRGFVIPRKLFDIQRFAKEIIRKKDKNASFNLENAWKFFRESRKQGEDRFGRYLKEKDYIVSHRALDDAWHEAKILYLLIKKYKFPIDKFQEESIKFDEIDNYLS